MRWPDGVRCPGCGGAEVAKDGHDATQPRLQRRPLSRGSFEFVHNVRRRGEALLGSLVSLLVAPRNPG
jgi:hypothetical protein